MRGLADGTASRIEQLAFGLAKNNHYYAAIGLIWLVSSVFWFWLLKRRLPRNRA